jgi:endo-1,4-beta-xylanase
MIRKAPWLLAVLPAVMAAFQAAPREVPLWSDGAPGSEQFKDKKEVLEGTRLSSIHNPSITVYLPAREKATGAALIIAPGGGHAFLTIANEGYDVAKWFADQGVASFVLKYRLAREPGSTYKVEVHALQDTQRAIRLVRSRAAEWGVNPASVGILGFSAGGELAALAATHFDAGNAGATDPIDRLPSRPDFVALAYPGYPRDWEPTKEMPPTFLLCASDDRPNISEQTPEIYLKLKKLGVPVEMHIYTKGGHGFGIRHSPYPVSGWPARLQEWIADRGFFKK